MIPISKEPKFDVPEEVKIKRRIVLFPLLIFFLSSFAFLLIYPDNGILIALTTGFLIGLIFKVCDWIESKESKLISMSESHLWIVGNLENIFLAIGYIFIIITLIFFAMYIIIQNLL